MRRPYSLSLAALGVLGLATSVRAQELTVERIFSPEFALMGVAVEWVPGGAEFLVVNRDARAGSTDIWSEGIRTGKRTRLVEGATLLVSDTARPIEIEEHQWSSDRSKVLIFANSQRVWRQNTKGTYYVYDVASRRLTPLSRASGWQMFAKFSPDGRRVGFVRDNDLFMVEVATGVETRLTHDGSETIVNGTSDWVYEEELDVRDAWRWSPDGKRIAYWRFDQSPVRTFHMIDEMERYSRPVAIRYPKAGTPNSRVRIGVLDLEDRRTTWMDLGEDAEAYLARMDFADTPGEIAIQRLNRHQNRLDLLIGDVTTGRTRTVLTERDSAWVDVDDDLTWLEGGREFLWTGESSGFNHIYLYERSGRLVRQVTTGAFDVASIAAVDERNGWVYFTAANPSPMERQLFRVGLDGRGMRRISSEPGTHGVRFSPDRSVYLDVYSRHGVPPVYRLHSADGRPIRVLEGNEAVAGRLRALPQPEFFSFTTSDGVRLNAWMLKPKGFDPAKRYPVMMYAYGGPGSQAVLDVWQGSRYLWHQLLADRGYLVVSVDNRGTGGRGRDFERQVYLRLGTLEPRDQVETARHLAALPYVDGRRIGLWGWSYGGYLTALSLMQGGDVFRAGISVAPVTDWSLYDTIYTERFMRTPQENPRGYELSAPSRLAARLESEFLLVHGTGDDNVHFQNTTQLAERLQAAGKQFQMMIYPNRTHSISGRDTQVHLYNLMTDWVLERL